VLAPLIVLSASKTGGGKFGQRYATADVFAYCESLAWDAKGAYTRMARLTGMLAASHVVLEHGARSTSNEGGAGRTYGAGE